MKVKEIVEMITILTGMSEDLYEKYKYMMISSNKEPALMRFFTKLFAIVDERRPKLLEMKGGAVV